MLQRAGGALTNAFDLKLKNPANTNVLAWGNRLFALWEVQHSIESIWALQRAWSSCRCTQQDTIWLHTVRATSAMSKGA